MKHFHLDGGGDNFQDLFYSKPKNFNKNTNKNILKYALGATLYIPAIRENLLDDVKKMQRRGAGSVVVCLEDSIPDNKLLQAERNLTNFLKELEGEEVLSLPLIFIRPRDPKHYEKLIKDNGELLKNLTGIVFPKFDNLDNRGEEFLILHKNFNKTFKSKLYYMPVIESPSVMHRETRKITLNNVAQLLNKHHKYLLAVRIGATDMSSAYGLRRNRNFTVYDVHVVSSAIADIVNVLGRAEDNRVITGAVWEHFNQSLRTFKPQLREGLFEGDQELRKKLLTHGYDNFIREIEVDKLNGIFGKTIIHPSHISIVHSLLVVTHEEFMDAQDILNNDNGGGAYSSTYKNKMNEVKPHLAWAKAINDRAQVFGVANEKIDFVDFLERFDK